MTNGGARASRNIWPGPIPRLPSHDKEIKHKTRKTPIPLTFEWY